MRWDGKEVTSVAFAGIALCLALRSVYYFYRSLMPPVEVYDNERGMLAFLFAVPALVTAVISTAMTWSWTSTPLLRIGRFVAWTVIAYVAGIVIYHASM